MWSSAKRMRTGSISAISIQGRQRQGDMQQSAASGPGIDLEGSAQVTHTLLHPEQAQAAHALGIEAAAVVLNAEQNFAGFAANGNLHRSGLRVAGTIIQRLLDHAV